jgi:hypothetical protein
MPLSLDGFDVLQRMAANQKLFAPLKAHTAEAAEKLLCKLLTSAALDLDTFRNIVAVLGEDTIELVLQTMDIGEVRALLERIEPEKSLVGIRHQSTAVHRLLKTAIDRPDPTQSAPRRTLKAVLGPLQCSPFSTHAMAPKLED